MRAAMEEEIMRWTVRRKSQLVLVIIHGRTSVSVASRQRRHPRAARGGGDRISARRAGGSRAGGVSARSLPLQCLHRHAMESGMRTAPAPPSCHSRVPAEQASMARRPATSDRP